MAKPKISPNFQEWISARKRHHLSHAHVQMARELGMNPRKLAKLDNHKQEPWKAPLPRFIEELYLDRFGRERPDVVMSIEERARAQDAKRAARKQAKQAARAAAGFGNREDVAPVVDAASTPDGASLSIDHHRDGAG
jgi:hypothetical protein